jgi:hypothetical protein
MSANHDSDSKYSQPESQPESQPKPQPKLQPASRDPPALIAPDGGKRLFAEWDVEVYRQIARRVWREVFGEEHPDHRWDTTALRKGEGHWGIDRKETRKDSDGGGKV